MTINPVNSINPSPPVVQATDAQSKADSQAKADAQTSAQVQANNQQQVQQSQQTEAQSFIANSQVGSSPQVTQAAVQLSPTAQQLMQTAKSADANTVYDQKKVDRLRKSISEGTYAVNNKQLASKFLELEKLLGKQGAT
jgi:negative regulator of flagellin synthesis FlgM